MFGHCPQHPLNGQRIAYNLHGRTAARGTEFPVKINMRVLVADDEKSVGTSLADLVRACEHEIVGLVGSGLEAIQAYSRFHPDVVLMDYLMPKLNGATACRNILAQNPAARVILVTGWSTSDCAIDTGALAILSKPVTIYQLKTLLDQIAESLAPPRDETSIVSCYRNLSEDRCVA